MFCLQFATFFTTFLVLKKRNSFDIVFPYLVILKVDNWASGYSQCIHNFLAFLSNILIYVFFKVIPLKNMCVSS